MVGILGLGVAACQKREVPAAVAASQPPPPPLVKPASAVPVAPVAAAINLNKVQGSWLRQDGGYRLVIGVIGEGGHAKGEYFNPNPIHVAWTRVWTEGGAIKVDAELRDTNYPGCIYKLTYDAAGDRLVGTYFQAQMQQTYEIEFGRQP
jgi:hypothetical protein